MIESRCCAACGGSSMVAHLRVGGEAGAQGLIPTTDRFGTALADIERCGRCGHMQLSRGLEETDLEQAYSEAESEDYVGEEIGQRATARQILQTVESHVARGGLVDVGCWVGFLLSEAQGRGWSPAVGVEPSAFASAYARERLGLDVRSEGLMGAELAPDAFACVVLADVIEHLLDPGAALDRVGGLLAPAGVLSDGGVVALALPDAGSPLARTMGRRWWSILPTHVQYFTRHSIGVLLDRHGFEVVELRSAPKVFTVGYYLNRLSGYSTELGSGLARMARGVGVADRLWAPDFRDRMLVIARRPNRGAGGLVSAGAGARGNR